MEASDPQSLNRYSYVSNDPVNRVDPSGLMEQICDAQEKCYPWEPPVATAYSGVDTVSLFGGYFTPASRSGGRNWFFAPLRPAPALEPEDPGKPGMDPGHEPKRSSDSWSGVKASELDYSQKRSYGRGAFKVVQTAEQHITATFA